MKAHDTCKERPSLQNSVYSICTIKGFTPSWSIPLQETMSLGCVLFAVYDTSWRISSVGCLSLFTACSMHYIWIASRHTHTMMTQEIAYTIPSLWNEDARIEYGGSRTHPLSAQAFCQWYKASNRRSEQTQARKSWGFPQGWYHLLQVTMHLLHLGVHLPQLGEGGGDSYLFICLKETRHHQFSLFMVLFIVSRLFDPYCTDYNCLYGVYPSQHFCFYCHWEYE